MRVETIRLGISNVVYVEFFMISFEERRKSTSGGFVGTPRHDKCTRDVN